MKPANQINILAFIKHKQLLILLLSKNVITTRSIEYITTTYNMYDIIASSTLAILIVSKYGIQFIQYAVRD